jgi:hypothetical protein
MKNKLNFNYINGAALYAFVRALLKIIDSTKLSEGILHTLVLKLETIYARFSEGVEYDAKDPLTPEAEEADGKRDQYYNGMKQYVHAFLKNPVEDIRTAAEKIEAVIRKYGWEAEKYSYDQETTAIAKCAEEIANQYADEAALLNLSVMWLAPLNDAQAVFESIQEQRIQNGAIEVPTMTKYRTPLRQAINELVSTLAIYAENSDDDAIKTYVAEIDELIGQTMARLRAAESREKNTGQS